MAVYHTIGVMSGTSLDGLDLALCRLELLNEKWKYSILDAKTIPYEEEWQKKLTDSIYLEGVNLIQLHNAYGEYIGSCINKFIENTDLPVDLIASHGHTVFHQPENKLTFQMGNGASIAAVTGITTVSDFRALDIALGGQGAPLVPLGDRLLFGEYDYCLNLGGFANISYEEKGERLACDVCPVNIVINHFAGKTGIPYDIDGLIARSGSVYPFLLNELNDIAFYRQPPPKSLSREWIEKVFMPVINKYEIPDKDVLRTLYEHISFQISRILDNTETAKLIITGGGALNKYLVELITDKIKIIPYIPDSVTVNFKEALIFALLGTLRYLNRFNCLRSATGSKSDSISGIVHYIKHD